jgi:site-specific recombinase XerD
VIATPVEDAISAFLSHLKWDKAAPKTIEKYRHRLGQFAAWAGDRTPGQISAPMIRLYLIEWALDFEATYNREPSGKTAGGKIDALSGLFKYLDANDLLLDSDGRAVPNPMPKVGRPKVKTVLRPWLRDDELAALTAAAIKPNESFLVRWLCLTGFRIVADKVRLMDIDLNAGQTGTISVHESKSEHGKRTIPILPELRPHLVNHLDDLRRRGLYAPEAPVLVTRHGTAVSEQQAWRILKRVGERANLSKSVSPQTCRRTFGSTLLNRGASIESVSAAMGHSNTAITQRYYAEMLSATVAAEILRVVS